MIDTQLSSFEVPVGKEINCPMRGWYKGRLTTVHAVLTHTAVIDNPRDRYYKRQLVSKAEVLVDPADVSFRPDPDSKYNYWLRGIKRRP